MKKIGILALAFILLTACSSDDEQRVFNVENETNVTLTFSPYTMVETRAATSIANVVTKLDVWIYENGEWDGEDTYSF